MQKRTIIEEVELLKALKSGNNKALSGLYKLYFPMILNFILNNNGSEQDAKDVFQESIIVLFNNIRKKRFQMECKIKTYLYSVCRRLWLNELKEKNKVGGDIYDVEGYIQFEKEEEAEFREKENQFNLMDDSLNELGEPCKTILHDFYVRKLSMSEIVEKMGYTNTDNAKNQKYKCLQRLKKIFFDKYNVKDLT